MKWFITGDTHGRVLERLAAIWKNREFALVILGDAGFNFYLNKTDDNNKRNVNNWLEEHDAYVYVVRGNHEERPENLGMNQFTDTQVYGPVYLQGQYPRIRYFVDGENYVVDGHSTLVVGGAYSVDKWHRLAGRPEDTDHWTGWFKDEQLTQQERDRILGERSGQYFDLVLTHTCPLDWMPRDLFLHGLDQSTVDNTMEQWMTSLEQNVMYKLWCFGHYHDNRLVRPYVEMYYTDIEELDVLWNRWERYTETDELDWWLVKDPMFYAN